MLDLQRLRMFRAVVESGSMNRTAERLGYTPSAVSQQVAALQRETGLQLFERVGRGVVPTAAGRALAKEAESVLTAADDLEATVAALRAGRRATLSVAAFTTAGTRWLPEVISTMAAEFPQVRIRLQLEETLTTAGQRGPDVVVVVQTPKASAVPAGYCQFDLLNEPYLMVVPATHPIAAEPVVALSDFADLPWIDNDRRSGPCRQNMIDACAEVGFRPTFVVETTDYPSAIAFVAQGLGVTAVPRLGVAALPAGVAVCQIKDPTPTRQIAVQMKDSIAGSALGRRMLDLLGAAAAT